MEINLSGSWKFRRTSDSAYHTGTVPGSVYLDLLNTGCMPDPFFRDHEEIVLKLADYDYEYIKTFTVVDLDYQELSLLCEGIDTLSEIFINGHEVGKTQNMHRTYIFDVKPFLIKGENEIKVVLKSPTRYIQQCHEQEPIFHHPGVVDGYTHLRKAHYMFGWDWGPQLPDLGIWKPLKIIGRNAHILDYTIRQHHTATKVSLEIDVKATHDLPIQIEVISPSGEKYYSDGTKSTLDIHNPQIWWHNGYGAQPLYDVKITLGKEDCKNFKIGLRELGIKKEKDEWGEKFCFIINGKEIFAMGSNYIPEDSLLSRMTEERTRKLLTDCALANHNCIRVWGGGIYPPDYFYEICDELGLIVWQDFMYACSLYNFDNLQEEVIEESIEQIKRLRHHSCIALWCGNNEQEEAWFYWGWNEEIAPKYKKHYQRQFEEVLPELVQRYDPERFYWPSSPSSGIDCDDPRDEHHGDMHYWTVWHGLKPFEAYKEHYFRFVSEYGFQSFPTMKTIESFTLESDRNIFSYVMEKHQKNKQANKIILHYLADNYRYPYSLEHTVYLSQLLQAEAMRYGAEHWRRNRGRCMGALYWQTNDCWPVASWSGIDYYGRWKALHYKSKHFFAPILLSTDLEDNKVHLLVINDSAKAFTGQIQWQITNAKGECLQLGHSSVSAPSLGRSEGITLDFSELLLDYNSKRDKVFQYTLIHDKTILSSACQLFIKPKHFNYENPHISFKQINAHEIEVTSTAFAHDIMLDLGSKDGIFSDNYFSLLPGEVKKIHCTATIDLSDLKVISVYDV